MGIKLLWTGLLLFLALPLIWHQAGIQIAGAVIMLIGDILMWLDK